MAEPAYAATIFDFGKCCVFQEETNRMFHSLACQHRLCFKVRGFATPHNVSTEKNISRRRVQCIGVNISHCASLSHRDSKLRLVLLPVVQSSVPLVLVAALSRTNLSPSGRCLRNPMFLYCKPLHSGSVHLDPLQTLGTSRVSSDVYGDTFNVSIITLL